MRFCITPGKLSQVPPLEVLIIDCDRNPEVPLTVEYYTTKDGYSSILVKYIITKKFIENQRVLFDPDINKALIHVTSSRTFHIY